MPSALTVQRKSPLLTAITTRQRMTFPAAQTGVCRDITGVFPHARRAWSTGLRGTGAACAGVRPEGHLTNRRCVADVETFEE